MSFVFAENDERFTNHPQLLAHFERLGIPLKCVRTTCPICWKILSTTGALKIHMRTHTGEKPFRCKVCGKGHIHKGNLDRHLRTVHGIVQNEQNKELE